MTPEHPMPDSHPQLPFPEALQLCPLCNQSVPAAIYEEHLRSTHALFAYRGVHRPLPDTLEVVRADLVGGQAGEAWPALLGIARKQGQSPNGFLAGQLVAALLPQPASRRGPSYAALAPLLLKGRPSLVAVLAAREEPVARLLALACLGRVRLPLPRPFRRTLRELLVDRSLPEEGQADALAALLPRVGEIAVARDLLRRFTDALGREQALQRLRRLEERTGPHPVLTPLIERLQEHVRMTCPRCRVELRRPALMRHLWDRHRLVLDGARIRDVWELVGEWLDGHKQTGDAGLLQRCRVASAKVGDDGPPRLRRMLLARELGGDADRRAVLLDARERHAACCPRCYALVSVPREVPPLEVNLRRGRLSAGGYSVEIDERGLRGWLEVRTPDELVYQGREPGRTWTPRGAAGLAALPATLLALVAAIHWPGWLGPPLWPVLALLLVAAAAAGVARWRCRYPAPSTRRLLDYAWRLLVPRLHVGRFVPADSAFLAGLAHLHGRVGLAGVPPVAHLNDLLRVSEVAIRASDAAPGHLAALCRLAVDRAAADGADPVPLVVHWVARCFDGKLPLRFAQQLLQGWAASWWTQGNLARLRVLLCDRAFEAGFEVAGLLEAGQTAPALGDVLRVGLPRGLAALRLVWSLRPTRPWDRLGDVQTAFELAADPLHVAALADHADVLLWEQDNLLQLAAGHGRSAAATVQLTPAGVWVQEIGFSDPPRVFEVRLRPSGSEMRMGEHVFRSPVDLEPLSRQLERWFRYAFHEFLPQIDRVLTWESPDRTALHRVWGAVACPECGRRLLPRVGEVGTPL